MTTQRQRIATRMSRWVQKPLLSGIRSHAMARRLFEMNAALLHMKPSGLRIRPEVLHHGADTVPCAWIDRGGRTERGVVLYLHGGGFVLGSVKGYAHLIGCLAEAAEMAGLGVDYRLAPEHPFPAALDDAMTAYLALLDRCAPSRIAIVGDSAGGTLALALLHRIGAEGLPYPGAVAAVSPATDMTGASPSLHENRRSDVLVPLDWAERGVRAYARDTDPRDPRLSPLFGRFAGAPPVMIQVVTEEVLRDDGRRMAEALRAQGVEVRLDEWSGVPHVWHLLCGWTEEADRGIADIADFIREHVPAA
ncbi:alpha/beta hydrolase [Tranquillimonas alkanivorans]|uniref:Acetyl esterase/lipase n=1 Tax=Tranquillimonas alkanivorans TaxID=441119 RepID=A0A1I5SKP5_9RHOB|nr:alpha/beta hydrolase [Tranquillimonas alkanivorans]SFP71305.1 Acetyl esterase/lipase [Tranquillimonas alkanivorans]